MSATKGSWSWQRNSRASHPWNRVVACKSKNLELVFNWWVFCCSPCFFWNVRFLFVSSWFELFSFLSRKLWLVFGGSLKKIYFFYEKDLIFEAWNWTLETLKLKFEFLRFEILDWNLKFEIWNLETWALKLDILKNWNLEFWKFVTWNFEHEIWSLKFWGFWIFKKLEIWDLGFWKKKKFEIWT